MLKSAPIIPPLESREPRNLVLIKSCFETVTKSHLHIIASAPGTLDHLIDDWLWGNHFTCLLVGYVCHMADVYWGPSGCMCHRTVSNLAWANSHCPREDKACWASLSRRKTDKCSVSGEGHPYLGLLPGRSIKQSYPLTCSLGLLGTYNWASPE